MFFLQLLSNYEGHKQIYCQNLSYNQKRMGKRHATFYIQEMIRKKENVEELLHNDNNILCCCAISLFPSLVGVRVQPSIDTTPKTPNSVL